MSWAGRFALVILYMLTESLLNFALWAFFYVLVLAQNSGNGLPEFFKCLALFDQPCINQKKGAKSAP